jgi:hypothetical protein
VRPVAADREGMTTFTPPPQIRARASWPIAVLCGLGGVAFSVASVAEAMAVGRLGLGLGLAGGVLPRLFALASVVGAVLVARALPRRARAAFVVGVVTPVVVAGALLALLLYSLATNPNAFTF